MSFRYQDLEQAASFLSATEAGLTGWGHTSIRPGTLTFFPCAESAPRPDPNRTDPVCKGKKEKAVLSLIAAREEPRAALTLFVPLPPPTLTGPPALGPFDRHWRCERVGWVGQAAGDRHGLLGRR